MTDIDGWRENIDEIDEKLVRLLNERMKCAQAIGDIKRKEGLPILNKMREKEIKERIKSCNEGPLGDDDLADIFAAIIELCRRNE